MTPLRLLFYDDSAVFGGHEVMLVRILESLNSATQVQPTLLYAEENTTLAEQAISACSRILLYPLPFASRSLNNIEPLISVWKIAKVMRLLSQLTPDHVVIVQGRIELGLIGLLSATAKGLFTTSYIPMAHPLSLVSANKFATMRDWLNKIYYRLPSRYVTIAPSIAIEIERMSGRAVYVLPNAVPVDQTVPPTRTQARQQLKLPQNKIILSVIGRIEILQKGQDVAIRALQHLLSQRRDVILMVVGDGKDRNHLEQLAASCGVAENVVFRRWTQEIRAVYAATDIILIPSRFEGVPLVMIEAIMAGRPVAGSAIDGLTDYLPAEWLAPRNDAEGLARTIASMIDARNVENQLEMVRHRMLSALSSNRF